MLLVSKICAALLLCGLRLFAGLVPLKVYRKLEKWGRKGGDGKKQSTESTENQGDNNKRKKRIDLFLSVFLCFGAGLLLSTCFIHMIPEVRESVEKAASSGHWPILEKFPFAEAVVCLGFFAVYLFEELGGRLAKAKSKQPSKKKNNKSKEPEENDHHKMNQVGNPNGQLPAVDESRSRSSSDSNPRVLLDEGRYNHSIDISSESGSDSESEHHHHHHHGHSHVAALPDLQQQSVTAAIRGFLLVFALSFHSIFEGLAIGMESTTAGVWFLFTAVTVHELAIMFCIGMEMLASSIRVAVYVGYMITLGCITPIGVFIGIGVTESFNEQTPGQMLTIGMLQGVAAGTLLYVTFLEVLERERSKHKYGLSKLCALFVGFVLLSLMEAWGHSNEDHNMMSDHVISIQPKDAVQYSPLPT